MTKTVPTMVLISCMVALTGVLAGCSAGALPGSAAQAGSKPTVSSKSAAQTLRAVPTECPKTAQVESEVGFALKDPTFTRNSATLNCKYGTDSTDDMVHINFIKAAKDETGGDIQAYLASTAAGGDVTMTQVNGLGQAAYALSAPKDNGAAIQLLNNGIQVTIILFTGNLGSVERVAQGCLAEK